MASRAILSNFFEEEWTQNHPQYFSGLPRALFPTTFLEIAVYVDLSSEVGLVLKITDQAILYLLAPVV